MSCRMRKDSFLGLCLWLWALMRSSAPSSAPPVVTGWKGCKNEWVADVRVGNDIKRSFVIPTGDRSWILKFAKCWRFQAREAGFSQIRLKSVIYCSDLPEWSFHLSKTLSGTFSSSHLHNFLRWFIDFTTTKNWYTESLNGWSRETWSPGETTE